tara:strand:+ start:19617 stop:20105 length:489 start_codon:yes stop_codon:yes gene_type:complete
MVWTNKGKARMFEEFFETSAVGTNMFLQLATATLTTGIWDSDVSSTNQVTLVAASSVNSATDLSGLTVARDGDSLMVSSNVDLGYSVSASRAVLATADNGFRFYGPITAASYVLLTSPGPIHLRDTNVPADNEIYAWWAIGSVTNITSGNTLTIDTLTLQGN